MHPPRQRENEMLNTSIKLPTRLQLLEGRVPMQKRAQRRGLRGYFTLKERTKPQETRIKISCLLEGSLKEESKLYKIGPLQKPNRSAVIRPYRFNEIKVFLHQPPLEILQFPFRHLLVVHIFYVNERLPYIFLHGFFQLPTEKVLMYQHVVGRQVLDYFDSLHEAEHIEAAYSSEHLNIESRN